MIGLMVQALWTSCLVGPNGMQTAWYSQISTTWFDDVWVTTYCVTSRWMMPTPVWALVATRYICNMLICVETLLQLFCVDTLFICCWLVVDEIFAIRNDDEGLWLSPTRRIWQGYYSHNCRHRPKLSESVEELTWGSGHVMKDRSFDTRLVALHHQCHGPRHTETKL